MAARHVLHLHAAEGGKVGDHAVQVRQDVVELDAAVPQAEVLVELIQNPPGVDRQPVADDGGDPAELVQRLPQAGVRVLLEDEREHVLFELAQRHVLREALGKHRHLDQHVKQCRQLERIGRIRDRSGARRRCAAAESHARRVRRSVPARTDSRPRGSAGRCPGAPAASATRPVPAASRSSPVHPTAPRCPCCRRRAASTRSARRACSETRVSPPGITTIGVARGRHVRPEHDRPRLHSRAGATRAPPRGLPAPARRSGPAARAALPRATTSRGR